MLNFKKLSIVAALLAAVPVTGVSARDFTVTSWGGTFQDAQRKIFFEPFIAKTGTKLLEESWDGGYGVLQAKAKAGQPNWDVVQVEAEELALGCADGIFEKLDWDKLGGKSQYLDTAVSDCGVGAIVWTMALSYDADKLAEGPKSWADFWDTKKFPGKRGLRKGAKYSLEFALLADGVANSDVYNVLATPEGVDRAFKKLDEIKGDLIWWEAGAQPLQLLSSGQVVMTGALNGRITGINRTEKKNFKVIWPGSIYSMDSWVILKGAEHVDTAQDFIAFASQAENQAKLPEFIAYGLPNKGAGALVPAEYRSDLPTEPENLENAISLDVNFWTDNGEELNSRFNAWLAQ